MLASEIRSAVRAGLTRKTLKTLQRAVALLAAALLMGTAGFSQQLSVSGTVRDAGGTVPEAAVSLTAPGGMSLKTATGGQGEYKFDNPGSRTLPAVDFPAGI